MLNKGTVLICIKLLNEKIEVYQNIYGHSNPDEWWNVVAGELCGKYTKAIVELKNELEIIEEENLSE
jgi:hypothetical protein